MGSSHVFLKENKSNKKTCSEECSKQLMKENQKKTFLSKYGVETNLQLANIRENNRQRLLKKETQELFKNIIKSKYGVDNVAYLDSVKTKREETNLKKYGTKNPLQNKNIQEKKRNTNLKKYGVIHPLQNKEILKKTKQTNFQKYGTTHPMKNSKVKQKVSDTMMKKYGSLAPLLHIKHPKDFTELDSFLSKKEQTISDLSEYFGISLRNMRRKICREKLQDKVQDFYKFSIPEIKIKNILDEMQVNYEVHFRKLIYPFEVDFYLPEYNVAIEVSPTFTHNIAKKELDYHYHKWRKCLQKNVRLITVFDNADETFILDIIKNSISPLQGISLTETEMKEEHKNFLRTYNINKKTKRIIELRENEKLIGVCLISDFIEPIILKQSEEIFNHLLEYGKLKLNNNFISFKDVGFFPCLQYIPEKQTYISTCGFSFIGD